jgi:hypothetical protein
MLLIFGGLRKAINHVNCFIAELTYMVHTICTTYLHGYSKSASQDIPAMESEVSPS